MESTRPEIAVDYPPFFRIYRDGSIERLDTETVPPGLDPKTNVESKEIVYSQETGQHIRLYIPQNATSSSSAQKLPLLVYFHGGAFLIGAAASPTYHNYLNSLVSEANVIAVSVDYRRAPEHPIPACFDDSWDALKWVASHHGGNGPEEWLNRYADFDRVYLAGDSAGANIAHHIAIRIGKEKPDGVNLAGIVLAHPYFWGKEPVGDEAKDPGVRARLEQLWRFAHPTTIGGADDPWINPFVGQSLASLGCTRVLVCVAEKDLLRHRGCHYVEELKKSGWGGEVELMEAQGEEHVFHLNKTSCENAVAKLKKVAAFMNPDKKEV
ncbi:Alpha/beta hydrolase-3 [Corchorus olitorius]|uniref:Alpha/beta hydrolase-3 n=1 Tax=Corchorus olitorius TaxID=93759 RepID=A0A1R3GYK4_9ROSI|nr:Alpha/beta hydrolase-3 [Corchorus olitorius]